ncbi:MAG: hypothetical protein KGJ79_12155 [Alphaproteobacteria bacterium]|nr:hypothetical protein [Alphaproteobacteria bacterium]MDE2111887.1 hypothetical protein [Alphaproteobacteria bacterium]MDE2264457.1 hypothetical protein [Alphaproteobacteria bacterium]
MVSDGRLCGTNDNAFAVVSSSYETLGNLNHRSDNLSDVFEYSCYGGLNRLTQYAVGNEVTSSAAATSTQGRATPAVRANRRAWPTPRCDRSLQKLLLIECDNYAYIHSCNPA